MENSLKPCPFCGKAPAIQEATIKVNGQESAQAVYFISCCGQGPYATSSWLAVEVWNHRAPIPATPGDDRVREAVLFTLQEEGYGEIQTNYMVPSIMAALAAKEANRG